MAQVWASSRDGSGREMPEAGSRKPEAMTAPRSREQSDPPSPPDRRPPRRGGGSSPSPCTCASAAGRAAGPARLCGARRGLVRSARALAAAALLALAGALALPATAQADVLVSNIGQTSDATATVGFGDLIGQVFTVASGGGNYTLTSIEVPVELLNTTALTAEDIELLSASLWSADEFGAPGSSLQALTNPSSISDGDTAAFTDPAGTTLEAGKLYAVMFVYDKSSAELAIKAVRSNDEDGESLSGWTIYNSRRNLAAGETSWTSDANSLQIRVNGSAAGGTPTCTLNTGDLWCGVVTVGAISSGGSVAAHGFAGADGGLDDKTFSVGTNNYTIDGLYVGTAGDLNLDLTGALDAADKGNLKLVVGSTDFDLDDATHVSSENAYLWTGTGLNWSSDTHVTLRLRRAVALSTDATLSGLTVYDGSSNLTLSPSFASGTETYTASAAYDIATVTVTATKNQADATVAWLDASDATLADADAMASGHQVALEAGANTFKVKVTAEDGTTTKTYTVTVNRASPSCTLNTGDLWCGVVTVGNGAGFDGYAASVSLGALSDRTFLVGTNNYTIDAIYVEIGGFNPERLTFNLASGLTSADQAALVLHLGSVEFEFSDANVAAGLSYKWSDTGLDWSSESFVTLRLRDTPVTNNAPVFSPTTATREVEENSAAGTNVGAVIPEATDSDSGDTLTYSMEGTDAASFAFDASTRQITTITGVTYNHEATKNSYSVTVKASDGTASATIAVTIDVTDVNEKSAKPDKPTLAKVTGSSTSLTATWTKPDLNGGPDIAGYVVQYREGTSGSWTQAYNGSNLTRTITGLTADTSYQARMRTDNGEALSDWSDASDAVKTNAAAVAPTISAVAVTSTPVLETDTYGAGERIEVTVTFSEAVNATSDTDFVLSVAGAKRAPLVRGSGTATLVFGYTVVPGDEDDNGIWIGDQDRTLVGNRDGDPQNGTITSVATSTAADLTHAELGQQSGHKVDGSRSIVSVAVSSTPMLQTDTYGAGETIRFTVTFNVAVDVSGDPVLTFALGNQGQVRDVDAAHEGGGGSTALVFAYTVVSTDEDNNGIFLRDEDDFNNPDGPVRLDSDDTIRFAGTSTDVPLYWQGRGTQSGHKVDGSRTTGNTAPSFTSSATFDAAENQTAVGTVVAADSDADDNITGYAITGGADQALFEIGVTTGELTFDNAPNFEDPEDSGTDNTYVVTVEATSGMGTREMTATQTITVTVTDADEKSAKPDKPTLAKVTGSSTSLTATWTKPDLNGGPEITGYAVQYKVNTATTWEDFAHSDTAVTTTVTGLTADTSYQVQVRAKNGETDSDWSDASDAVKTNAEMSTPTCTLNTGDIWCGILTVGTSTSSGTTFYGYDLHESQGSLSPNSFMYDGNTITVTGLQYDVGSGNALRFDFTTSLGTGDFVLHVGSQSFDFTGGQASYSFTSHGLSWSSGNTVEVRLREAATAPGEPTDLTATANGTTRIDLSWTAPADDGGSAITGYRIEVSTDAGSNWSDLVADTANTDTTYSHTGLSDGDTRHYQVSAINAVGTSDASNVANATTGTPPTTCTLNTGDLWCGVVTVGQFQRPPFLLDGFGEGEGDLSDTEFTYGTNSYTIDIAATELNNTALFFSLTSALTAGDRAALELHVAGGNASFAFSAANHNSSDHTYTWRDTGLDWSSESFVELRLRAATETDATLSALTVTRSGGATVPLRPAFAPGTGEYRAWVANRVDEVTVAATANVAEATLAYLDGDGAAIADADTNTPGREVALEVGATVVEVKVTAEDDTTMRTYRVTVTRSTADDDLADEGEFRLAPETVVDYADPDNDRYGGTGPVEVYHAGAWGTVCRDGIRPTFKLDDNNELIVDSDGKPLLTNNGNEAVALICKAMNYDDGEYHMKYGKFLPGAAEADHQVADYWPPGSSYPAGGPKPIWLDDLRCVAGESALGTDPLPGAMSHCSYAGWGLHNCTHEEDAVVRCWNNDAAGAGLKSLKGRFVSPPERHDGTNRVKVRVAFSEPVEESPENVGAHGVEVEGGEVTSVSPVGGAGTGSAGGRNAGAEDREVVWEFEIEPDSDGDLTVTLEAGRPCGEPGAICTADGRALSEGISTTVEGPEAPPPLTASFEDLPAAHDGSAFTFRVAFSRDIGISYEALREDAFAVSGGRTTRGARVDDRRDLFEMTVEPDGGGDVAITLEADRDCAASGAICTKGEPRRRLTNSPSATVAGPDGAADGAATGAPAIEGTARVGGTLTATTADIADRDGLDDVEFAYRWMRGDADIAGADGRTYAAADADLGERLKVRVEFADDAGNAERLTSEPTDAVAAADEAAPLTARFEDMPAEHRGEGGFKFRAAFSEDIGISYKALREDAFAVTGGRVTGGKRVDDRRDLFEMTVRPDGGGDVGIALEAGRECAESGAICTKGEPRRKLANSPSATVAGPGEAPANTPAEGRPAISGTARVGEALTASTSGVSDADGLENAEFAYQWRRGGADIPGADGASYAVVEADEGERLKVRVAFEDDAGNEESLTSAATDAVKAAPRANAPAEGAPAIRGKARVGEALTASTSGVSDADGLDNAMFAYQWLRGGADIPGADGRSYTAADADEGERLKVRVAFADDAGNAERLTSAATDAVEAAPRANAPAEGAPAIRGKARVGEALTASTSGVTDADGLDNAVFAHQWLRGGADIPGATGATYAVVDADEGERLKVRVEFADDAGNEESLTSAATKAVAARPRPKASVADARVREAAGATLDFAVTLSIPAPGAVTVGYRTMDASAKAGEDYEARAGKLRFGAGETAKTLRVKVLDDAVDEGDEKMVVVLEPGAGVDRGDRLASGTIENGDPLPAAWLARFGRTASDHAAEAIEERFRDPGGASHATFGGRRLWGGGGLFDAPAHGGMPGDPFACGPFGGDAPPDRGADPGTNAGIDCGTGAGTPPGMNAGPNGAMGAGMDGGMSAGTNRGLNGGLSGGMGAGMDGAPRGPSATGGHRPRPRDLLLGSSFRLSASGADEYGAPRRLTAWGRAAATRFDGVADGVAVDGEVATFLVGADASRNRWLAGITVAHSVGAGAFRGGPGGGAGGLDSTLTAVHPYARWRASERLSAWGALGYGAGDLALETNGSTWETDTSMRMAAGGLRGVFLRGAGGLELAARTDVRLTRIASDGVEDNEAGLLAAAAGGTSRLRLLVEGSRPFRFGERRLLTPTLEIGVRRDGGDAETGAGIDLGGSLRYADAALGLTVDAAGRYLVAHEDAAYREWGASASMRIDPGAAGRGLTLSVTPSWGASASGGAGRLWSVRDARGLAGHGFDAAMRLRADVGYGLSAFRGMGAVAPFLGLSTTGAMGRDWRFGARWTRGAALRMSLEATRREAAGLPPAHGIQFGITWRPGARGPSPAAGAAPAGAPRTGARCPGDGTRRGPPPDAPACSRAPQQQGPADR